MGRKFNDDARGRCEVLEQTRVKMANANFPSFRSPGT